MLFTERGLPSCLCLLREISFKLKTQKAKEQKTTLCLRRGAATSAQGRRPARVRLPRPASAPPLRSGRPATPPRAQAGTPAAGPDRPPGARGWAGPGQAGPGAPLRQAPEESGGRGGRTPPPRDFSQARNLPPNAHSPDKNEASAFAGTSRAPLRRAPRAPGKAGMGSGRGRARAAALRAGAQRRGPGWALRCPGR